MPSQNRNNWKIIAAIAVVLAAVLVLAFFLRSQKQSLLTIPQLGNIEVKYLTGSILNIEDTILTLFVSEIMGVKVPANFKFILRKVVVGPTASIVLTAPERTLTLGDLKIGDTISVSEAGYPDLKYKETVVAAEIIKNNY